MDKIVIVCGAIRQPLEFKLIISKLIKLKNDNIINKIIVSTWLDEFEAYGDLKESLLTNGVDVLESTCPSSGGVGNSLRQKKTLLNGLRMCPDSSLVLKVRTDKCYKLIDQFVEHIKSEDIPKSIGPYGVFSNKVIVQDASVAIPFLISDKIFLGYKEDLLLLTNSSSNIDSEFCNARSIGAETRWFIEPFLSNFPAVRYYYTFFSNRNVSTVLLRSVRDGHFDIFPKQILAYLMLYYRLLSENFCLVDNRRRRHVDEFLDLISTSTNSAFIRVDTRAFREESFFRNQQSLEQAVSFVDSSRLALPYDCNLELNECDIAEINEFNFNYYKDNKLLSKPYRLYKGRDNYKNTKLLTKCGLIGDFQISQKNYTAALDKLISFIDDGKDYDCALFLSGKELIGDGKSEDGELLIKESFKMKYPDAVYYFAEKLKDAQRNESIALLKQSAAKGHKKSQVLLRDLLVMERMHDKADKWNSIL